MKTTTTALAAKTKTNNLPFNTYSFRISVDENRLGELHDGVKKIWHGLRSSLRQIYTEKGKAHAEFRCTGMMRRSKLIEEISKHLKGCSVQNSKNGTDFE